MKILYKIATWILFLVWGMPAILLNIAHLMDGTFNDSIFSTMLFRTHPFVCGIYAIIAVTAYYYGKSKYTLYCEHISDLKNEQEILKDQLKWYKR